MKVKELMSGLVIRIHDKENVFVAARTLTHYNIGVLPVCSSDGKLCGVLTDRDIVTRCMAQGRDPEKTTVRQIMSPQVISVTPDMDSSTAAHLMGSRQVRRLPVVEDGKVCGMLSLADLAKREESIYDAADALTDITESVAFY